MMSLNERINAFTDNLSVEQIKQFCMILAESKEEAVNEAKQYLVKAIDKLEEREMELEEIWYKKRGAEQTKKYQVYCHGFALLEKVIDTIENYNPEDTTE